jgi:hypothetical protein
LAVTVAVVAGAVGATAAGADATPANTAVTTPKPYSYQEPWLTVDPKNPQRMAIAYREGAQRSVCNLALSNDGGATWRTQDIIGPQGRLAWPSEDTLCYEAVAAFGSDGTLYYAVQATISFRDPFSRVFVTSSPDGVAFRTPVDVDPDKARNPGDVGGGDWYPRLAASPSSNEVFVRWTHYASRNASAQTVISRTTDHGTTFSTPVVATPSPTTTTSLIDSFGTALAVDGSGTVYTSWLDLTQRQAGCSGGRTGPTNTCSQPVPLQVAASHDGGRSFGPAVTVDPAVDFGCPGRNVAGTTALASCDNLHFDRGPEAFSLTAGPGSGTAYLAWWGGDPEKTARISFSDTHDGGRTWSAPRAVGTLRNAPNDEQQRPALGVAANGRVDMAYYDDTNGGDQDVYLVSSDDGGKTFSTPQLVTSTSSNINVGPVSEDGVHPGFGEWLGLYSTNNLAAIAWTDTRRGSVDSAKQDIYFAAVPLSAGTPLWVPIVAGVGGAALLIVVALTIVAARARARTEVEAEARPTAGRV